METKNSYSKDKDTSNVKFFYCYCRLHGSEELYFRIVDFSQWAIITVQMTSSGKDDYTADI